MKRSIKARYPLAIIKDQMGRLQKAKMFSGYPHKAVRSLIFEIINLITRTGMPSRYAQAEVSLMTQ